MNIEEQNIEKKYYFPDGFLWGAATSAHQIEGGLNNSWSDWEKSEQRIADLKKLGKNPDDFMSGSACNSWNMMDADIDCLKLLNLKAYRFSIDWSRVEPEEGKFDQAALDRYKEFVDKLLDAGIEPFVTIWHWPVPIWLRDQGGWENPKIVRKFVRLSNKLVLTIPKVKYWITLNEPEIFSSNSYLKGIWPPQKKNPFAYWGVLHNLIAAHRFAFVAIKEQNPNTLIGIAKNNIHFEAKDNKFINKLLKKVADWWINFYILDKIADRQDFIGLNHYFHNLIDNGFGKNYNEKVSDMGWELYPAGLGTSLIELKKYNKPIYITENGLADASDKYRAWFLREHLRYTHQAIEAGVDVRGYFHWSLLDNFEWAHGFDSKFGLFSVDRQTFVRTPRPSALEYAEICKENRL